MKSFHLIKSNNIWLFGAVIFLLHSSSTIKNNGIIDHFKIGDVIYSILEPKQFTDLHGSGWVLMDGRELKETDDLRRYYGAQLLFQRLLPNGRGAFIRSMNYDKAGYDKDPNRAVGSLQWDELKQHTHTYVAGTRDYTTQYTGGDKYLINPGEKVSSATGGAETRPVNIAMYTYIKIND